MKWIFTNPLMIRVTFWQLVVSGRGRANVVHFGGVVVAVLRAKIWIIPKCVAAGKPAGMPCLNDSKQVIADGYHDASFIGAVSVAHVNGTDGAGHSRVQLADIE